MVRAGLVRKHGFRIFWCFIPKNTGQFVSIALKRVWQQRPVVTLVAATEAAVFAVNTAGIAPNFCVHTNNLAFDAVFSTDRTTLGLL